MLNNEIHEEFIGFSYAESFTAEANATYILNQILELGLDIKQCIGQSYDGASVMSGQVSGVQARIKASAELAIYVHCYAHRLNLVVVDCCKCVKYTPNFFALIQRLYVFISGSFLHSCWLFLQKELLPNEKSIELKSLSNTRWTSKIATCQAIKS